MTSEERRWKKNREKAAKLRNPTPQELPSHAWRCQVMVNGERQSFVDEDPEVAHAMAVAARQGLIQAKREEKRYLTLEKAMEKYLDDKEAVLSPATIRGYDNIKRNHFQDIIQENIYTLTEAAITASVKRELKLRSAKTVKNSCGFLGAVLSANKLTMPEVELPQIVKPNKRYLQPKDIGHLIQVVQGDSCEVPILIAVWLGLRRSEIIGLCWEYVDFQNNTLTIRRAVVPNKNHQWVMKDGAKNTRSQRTIDCPDYIMGKLKEMYTDGATGRIFQMHPDTVRKHIHRACKKAGITDTTVHGLRHTNAAVMKSLGVNDLHAMERGGWSSLKTYQDTYSYVFDQEAQKDNKKINNYIEKLGGIKPSKKTRKKLHTDLHTKDKDA